MKTFSKSHFEILFLKKLLNSEGFLGKGTPKRASEMNGFLLGFRKGSVVFDLEKSLTMYFKALRLIKACRESSYSILFVGCPPLMELSLQKSFIILHTPLSAKAHGF